MNRLHNAWLIVCLAGLGAGCATMSKMYCSNIASRNYTFVPGKKDGLVVVSFTDPGSCSTWCYRDLKDTNKCHEVSVRSKGGGKAFYSQEIYHDKSVMYALVLPEGDYEFYGWGRNSLYSATEFSIQFKSTAGKAQYVGNLYMEMLGGGRSLVHVTPKHEEEIPLFKQYYRNITDDQIDVQIMKSIGRRP